MLNQESITTNSKQTISPSHVRPDYAAYNFANIPGTVLKQLGVPAANSLPADVLPSSATFDKVIFLLIDAFGWNLFQRFAESSALLGRFQKDGVVSQLTSQFPSTTTAHVTTINTGQAVGEHGMFEWNYYEPAADAVICPLFYSYAGDSERGTMFNSEIDPAVIFPRHNIYSRLAKHNVASYIFTNEAYAASPYNSFVNADASHEITFSTYPEALDSLRQAVENETGPAYFYLYWGNVDALAHVFGPRSSEAFSELIAVLDAIESNLLQALSGTENTLLLIGADHGQDQVDPARTIYLNHLIPDITGAFRTNGSGRPIVPGGSAKDFFLYIKEDALDDTQALLMEKLAGKADVLRVDRLIDAGYFGNQISDRFLSRVGNLVIVPNAGETVWWDEPGRFTMQFRGHHGGLSANEMLTPFLALPF